MFTLNTTMRVAIAVSFIFYIASVTAIEKSITDLRFPIDSQIIQATLNKSDIIHLRYTLSENVINYHIVGTKDSCGSYKIKLDKNSTYAKYFHLLPLNRDNILVIPMEYDSSFKEYPAVMEIVNMPSCQRTEVLLPEKNKPTEFRITRYINGFDIYYKDSFSCLKNYCRAAYDFQGKVIPTPVSKFISHKSVPLVKPIGSGERSNKYLAFEFTDEKTIVNLIDSEQVNVLVETADTKFIPEVSDSNNLISIIYRGNFDIDENQELITNLELSQFDFNGKLKFKTTVKYNATIRTVRMLNAPNGGVYLVASACDRDHCTDEQNIYSVKKIDANGKEVGSFSLRLLSPGIIEDLAFYKDSKLYCLTRLQLTLGVSGSWQFKKLDAIYNCFDDKDFE